jgi:hypothetical protein
MRGVEQGARPDDRGVQQQQWEAAKSASGPATAAAVSTDPGLVQPAAISAATPLQAWALEKRDSLVLMGKRLRTEPLESPEMTRNFEGCCDLNVSAASWADE